LVESSCAVIGFAVNPLLEFMKTISPCRILSIGGKACFNA
jgi:hypothetical protein